MNLKHSSHFLVLGRAIALVGPVIFGIEWFVSTRDAAAALIVTQTAFSHTDNVITFETGSTNLPTVPGVIFNPGQQDGGDATFANSRLHTFGNQYFGDLDGGDFLNAQSYLAISFSTPQPAVGAYLIKASSIGSLTSLISTVYGINGQPIKSVTTPLAPFDAPTSQLPFVGFYEPAGISEIEWSYPAGHAGGFGVDNVVYGTVVPEPGNILLSVIGVFGFAAMRSLRMRLIAPYAGAAQIMHGPRARG
jgi:hypothetical protein